MKNTIDKLNSFIIKIILLLEEELDKIETTESQNTLKIKGNIINTLNKLVTMIARLNKISKEDLEPEFVMSQEDKEIIKQYIEKYK